MTDPYTRIHYTYRGGPLDGEEVKSAVLPQDPAKSFLHTMTRCLKGEGVDRYAQGKYHLEQQDGAWVAIHEPSDEDEDWHVLEVKQPELVDKPEKATNLRIDIPKGHPLQKKLDRLFPHLIKKTNG